MVRLLVALAGMIVVLFNCSSRETGRMQSENMYIDMEIPSVAQELKLIKYEDGQESDIRLSIRDQDSLIETVINLFRDSEPLRVYIEDEEMQIILENRTGFVMQFNPWLRLPDSDNQLYEIMFLTLGEFSNSSQNPDMFFFVAIDGKDFIRSPFIANVTENKFSLLKELLDH